MEAAANILALACSEFTDLAGSRGVRPPAAIDLYRRAFREGSLDAPFASIANHPVIDQRHERGTIKFLQRHEDGLETESVILPITSSAGRARNTLCVSSQVGCAMGCTFCETAQMGFMKNLSAAEIVGQWHAARFAVSPLSIADSGAGPVAEIGVPIHNIVFMGMGEPMENIDNVIQAIRVLTDRNGASIAPARISVSTVGRVNGIARLAELAREPGYHKLRLAVSINAPNDAVRSRIMPVNRSTPMAELKEAMLEWPLYNERLLLEYVLIPGVNDGLDHADELCDYLRGLACTVNVIPYNPRRDSPWPAPAEESVRAFTARIHAQGQFVKRRQTMGRSVMAACGQLGNPDIRGRKRVADARSASITISR